ncbi:MAG TPA: hypothetical protein VLH77_05095 [Gammaproteobacteria bacterium]|nr:hypothetical protein [Gammaproteobacteria bacterium]
MKKADFSLGLIIASNILIIVISLIYGLHIFPFSPSPKSLALDKIEDYKELLIKK